MRFRAMPIINRFQPGDSARCWGGDRDAVRSRAARSFEIETESIDFAYAYKTHSFGS